MLLTGIGAVSGLQSPLRRSPAAWAQRCCATRGGARDSEELAPRDDETAPREAKTACERARGAAARCVERRAAAARGGGGASPHGGGLWRCAECEAGGGDELIIAASACPSRLTAHVLSGVCWLLCMPPCTLDVWTHDASHEL